MLDVALRGANLDPSEGERTGLMNFNVVLFKQGLKRLVL